jgi:SAM-dependent methyltransferase
MYEKSVADQIVESRQLIDNILNLMSSLVLNAEVSKSSSAIDQQAAIALSGLAAAGLSARADRLRQPYHFNTPQIDASRQITLSEQLALLEQINPRLFPIWSELFENGRKAYEQSIEGNISHHGNPYARAFSYYVDIFASGAILDIGTGPFGIPSYLQGFPSASVFGVEPLSQVGGGTAQILQSLNEFLPWRDGQFDTVVSGTSLDHVFSLEASLAEVKRVLKPDGLYLIWLGSITGAPAFDETQQIFKPIDDFHLFHFDRNWIEPILTKKFQIADVTIVPQVGFDHVFYCLKNM